MQPSHSPHPQLWKVLLCVLCLAALTAGAASARQAALDLRVPDVTAASGSQAAITIEAQGAQDIGALHIELVYDPAVLAYESIAAGSLAQNSLIDAGADTPGRLVISLATLNSLNGDGPVAVATFQVLGQSGQSSPLTLEKLTAWQGATLREVQVTPQPGTFTVGGLGSSLLYFILVVCALALLGLIALLVILRLVRRKPARPAPQPAYAAPAHVPSRPAQGRPAPPQPQRPAPPQGQVIYCANCGTAAPVGARFCQSCGTALNQPPAR